MLQPIIMGRLNKKLQQKERKKGGGSGISKSAVLATLADRDKKKEEELDPDRYNAINFKQPKKLPNTLDELDQDPDFQLLLDVPSFKADKSDRRPGTFNPSNRVKKKDKMKIKADLLRKKLHVCEVLKKEEKAAKNRKKTAVVGDMKPMADTLDVIVDDIKQDEEEKEEKKRGDKLKAKVKAKGTLKQKKAQQNFLKNMSIFNQVNKHPDYVKNPLQTISTHIENKMILESMELANKK